MAQRSPNGVSQMHYHPEYYLRDGDVTFHVEGTLFRVHRHFFERESQFFVKEFAKAPKEGTSDFSAFRLDQVNSADFARFLWVWYSPSYRRESKPKDHWLSILELSTIWQFPEIKQLAIDELQKLNIEPVEKITIYDKYQIDRSLLLSAYKFLCKRASHISEEEGERLRMPTVLRIYEARERAYGGPAENRIRNPISAGAGDEELEKILIDVFSLKGHATNGQDAQPPVKSDDVPIMQTPKPHVNGATNGHKTPASGSVSKNVLLETVCCGTD
ncbi:uncharacterized protein EDB93DRAFT_1091806 [Suillus bovinus]|uniref:uncharacterized protein n=1 Tax=Suillus bovinus TaxID=48563 RepID=UPI001B870706|nr:uncharacterized protein EDB93DRAFT_1091806 [Suillus bovinus]KAG2136384.1 hypothetical protein EDB93DRAFT_1091806 [Suillus bovinus]